MILVKDRAESLEQKWSEFVQSFQGHTNAKQCLDSFIPSAPPSAVVDKRRIKTTLVSRIGLPTSISSKKTIFSLFIILLVSRNQRESPWNSDGLKDTDTVMSRPITNCSTPKKIVKVTPNESTVASDHEYNFRRMLQDYDDEETQRIASMAVAYAQCLTGQVTLEFPINFVQTLMCLLKLLRIGHQVLKINCAWESLKGEFLCAKFWSENLMTPLALFKYAISCFGPPGGLAELIISSAFPDAAKSLEKNALLQIGQVKIMASKAPNTTRSLSLSSANTLSLHSVLPIAYTNQRDSRNFMGDPIQYANQQRIRDLFLNLIRHYSTLDMSSALKSVGFRRGFSSRVMELMSKLSRDNCSWLADLFMQEYEQTADLRVDRLLEERMKASSSSELNSGALDQILFLFLKEGDSYRLIRAVERKSRALTEQLMQQSNAKRHQLWADNMRRLRSLVKLLAFCRYQLHSDEPEENEEVEGTDVQPNEDLLVLKWIQEAIAEKTLLTLLPILIDLFKLMGMSLVRKNCSSSMRLLIRYQLIKFSNRIHNRLQRNQLFIKLALEDLFREVVDNNWLSGLILEEQGALSEMAINPNTTHNRNAIFVDEDDTIPIVAVYRSVSSQIRQLYYAFNSVITVEDCDGSTGLHNSVPLSPIPGSKRVVRPIIQVPAADLQKSRIQKQLRHWFWWRYAAQKELIDGLTQYLIDHLLLVKPSTDANTIKENFSQIFGVIVKPLLPKPLFEHQEMVDLIIGLSHEHAFKLIDQRHEGT